MSKRIAVLGVHHSGPTASAALIIDGEIVGAVAEERLSRNKQDRSFPHRAIDWCLSKANLRLRDLTAVAIGWNAGENAANKYRGGFSDWMRYPGEWLASVPNHLLPQLPEAPYQSDFRFKYSGAEDFNIRFVDHHSAHLELTHQLAGRPDAAFMTADGWSERKTFVMGTLKGGEKTVLKEKSFPHSLGCYYAAFTEYLGYRVFSDEWRVMGMAAYGNPGRYRNKVRSLVRLLPEGDWELDLNSFGFYNFDFKGFYGPRFEELFGPAREAGDELEERHYDLAAAVQEVFEETSYHCARWLKEKSGMDTLLLSGGCAMNCLANGRVGGESGFSEVHVGFAAEDSGNSVGAAMLVARELGSDVKADGLSSRLGPSFSDEEIETALERYGLGYTRPESLVDSVVDLLAADKVVGWFQGNCEFGPRALGGRSILASPLDAAMKDTINSKIKYREAYRPFAPVLPEEAIGKFFEADRGAKVPYMEKALPFRTEYAERLPAVVHNDGTGRLQTVSKAENRLLWDLLHAWEEKSGMPVLINTSFNLNGEPIVCAPEDALRTFVTSGIDALVLGSFVLEKGKI